MIKQKFLFLFLFLFTTTLALPGNFALADLQMPDTTNTLVEARVREYFADIPDMITIAKCESGLRQFGPDGQPLRGGAGGNYIGIFQVGAGQAETAKSLGWDIYSVEGNLAYARYLYTKRGTEPWVSCLNTSATPTQTLLPTPAAQTNSSSTVPSSPSINLPPSTPIALTINLQIAMQNPQVAVLQKLLNSLGFTIASSGPGSPGNETTLFGQLTKAAVMRFQCQNNITCSGSESTTGYGRLGPKTRATLLQSPISTTLQARQ